MSKISSIGKFLDQPILTAKINKNMPLILGAGSGVFLAKHVSETPKEKKLTEAYKTAVILTTTAVSALMAPRIASFITKRGMSKKVSSIIEENSILIEDYLSKTKVSQDVENVLNKAKNKILSLKEISILNNDEHKPFLNKLIPPPENIRAKDIFKEIGWLSIYGIIPVAGGITGGIIADSTTEKNWKSKLPNKIKEGLYQYLANIFMCNIGAGAALGILEKCNIKSKMARCVGMFSGILLTGVIGGSAIANYIGNKVINPLILHDKKKSIRTPELLDLSLHTDDIATVSLLSGLKWIEPSLPVLYSVSGYRAGIGYRNDHLHKYKDLKKKICPPEIIS